MKNENSRCCTCEFFIHGTYMFCSKKLIYCDGVEKCCLEYIAKGDKNNGNQS